MNNDLAYFLGLWIAEGSFEEKTGRITITCGDADVGITLESGSILGVQFKNSTGRSDQWRANSYELLELMRFLKMPLVKAPQKWLPEFAWSGTREWAEHLLSGMFDGDGYVSANRYKAGYTTSSKQLAQDVQLLLTNFGIMSRLTAVKSEPTMRVAVSSVQYRVEILGANVSRLKSILHLRIKRKAEALGRVPDNLLSRRDTLPAIAILEKLKCHLKRTKRHHLHDAIAMGRKGSELTYEKLRLILEESSDLCETAEYRQLAKLAADHYYWDEVIEVEKSESKTYDFTIPDTHSFWSNGFISHNTPKAYNHLYAIYTLGQDPRRVAAGQWESWQFPTITSPFIPIAEIEAARADMDEKSFQQEFEASFLTMSGRVYYPFDRAVHVGHYPFNPDKPIWIGQDFNIDPMSTAIMQPQGDGRVWVVDEIIRYGSNTEDAVSEIERRYWRYKDNITIFPDPAGGARQHARGETDLDIFRERGFGKIRHRSKHPAIADRVNCVNRRLRTASGDVALHVNRDCKEVIGSFEQTLYKKGSRDIDKSLGTEHVTDAIGYCIELNYPLRKIEIAGLSI